MKNNLVKISLILSFLNLFFILADKKDHKLIYGGNKTIKEYQKEKAFLLLKHHENRYLKLLDLNKNNLIPLKEFKEAEINYKIAEIDYKIAEILCKSP